MARTKLKDSNVAALGSAEHHDSKRSAAEREVQFKGAGKKVGLEIWRVENIKATAMAGPRFGIKKWPKRQYGTFYSGDSFICLSTTKDPESDKLFYDIYYWLGAESSQDELGVAAYKVQAAHAASL